MAKRKSSHSPRRQTDSARRRKTEGAAPSPATSARRAAAPKPIPDPQPPLFTAQDVERLLARFVEYMTVRRTVQYTAIALAVLIPLGLVIQRETLAKAKADRAFARGEWESASKTYLKYITSVDDTFSEDVAEACVANARCLLETGAPAEAMLFLLRIEKDMGKIADQTARAALSADRYALLGWALLETDKAAEAAKALGQAIALDARHPVANYQMARYYLAADDLRSAAPHFRRLAENPDYAEAYQDFRKRFSEKFLQPPESELANVPIHKPRPTPEPKVTPAPPPKPVLKPTPTPPAVGAAPKTTSSAKLGAPRPTPWPRPTPPAGAKPPEVGK